MLQDWFKNKDYQEGLRLLAQYNVSPIIMDWLNKSENIATKSQLEKELKKILDETIITAQKPPEKPQKPAESESIATKSQQRSYNKRFDETAENAPDEVKALVKQRNFLINQRRALKGQLNQMAWFEKRFANDERGMKADEYQAIIDEHKEVWKDIEYYREFGKLPEQVEIVKEIDYNEVLRRVSTLRTYISKGNKAQKKPKRFEEYKEELQQLEAALRQKDEQNSQTK